MTRSALLTVSSLLSILLLSVHISDDIARGLDAAGPANHIGIAILVVLVYGTLMLRERMGGLIITLLTGLFALLMPVIHLRGTHIQTIAESKGGLFFIWTLFALGIVGAFTSVVSVHQIVGRRGGQPA
jgi:hypothetical protein